MPTMAEDDSDSGGSGSDDAGDGVGDDWVEIRRYVDPLQAHMVKDFLRGHGVRVSTRGDPGPSAVLNRFATIIDIRLDVPRGELATAEEALDAMESEGSAHPFRGGGAAAPESIGPTAPPRRTAIFAAFLACLFPLGAGHFYARHNAAGTILGAGIVGGALGGLLGQPTLFRAAALLVAADALGSIVAVKRHNEQRIPSEASQRRVALVAVAIAFAAALLVR